MAVAAESRPSFNPYRKWATAVNVGLVVALVFAVLVMVNYLSNYHFLRLNVSTQRKVQLFPRTVKLLQTLTNSVKVTVYYDKDESSYSTIVELLNEYRTANPKIALRIVDYKRDPAAAQLLAANYNFLNSTNAKNLIIFDGGNNRVKKVDGNILTKYTLEVVPNEKEREYRRKPILFEGERAFTSALIAVTSPKPFRAYFLKGHGEHEIDSSDERFGYLKLASLLRAENYIEVESLSLLDTNHPAPADCNLLVVSGPITPLDESELAEIDRYLTQGGRLLALFNFSSLKNGETGLEKVLAKWGVNVTSSIVHDPERHRGEYDVIVQDFSATHPVMNPLLGFALHLIMPRAVGKLHSHTPAADAPTVDELAFSGPKSYLGEERNPPRAYPLMVAVEKGNVKGVITERGTTRMVVVGDSNFLANQMIDSAANRDFAGFAVNWLLDRPQLVEGIGARAINEYRLVMTNSQLHSAQWILLGGMPGAILVLGSVVWLRRRS
jgi:gliding motility-associatede transport system auxiliary component